MIIAIDIYFLIIKISIFNEKYLSFLNNKMSITENPTIIFRMITTNILVNSI